MLVASSNILMRILAVTIKLGLLPTALFEALGDVVLSTRNNAFKVSVVPVKALSGPIVMELEAKPQSVLRRKPPC